MDERRFFFSNWFYVSVLAVAAAFVATAFAAHRAGWDKPPPCSHYADYPMKDVPARCIKEFQSK